MIRVLMTALLLLTTPALATEAPSKDQITACHNAARTGQLGQCRSREALRHVCLAWPYTGLPLPNACWALIEPGAGE